MNFDEILKNRHSTRVFSGKTVTQTELTHILNSALLAPSAKNRQPWKFYILNDDEKTHIVNMLLDWEMHNRNERTSVKGSASQINSANKMIMIYAPNYKSKSKNINYKKPDYLSLGCALENMCLKAVDLGLGTCIVCDTLYIEEEINHYLGIKDLEQICGFIVGTPYKTSFSKTRKKLEDVLLNS